MKRALFLSLYLAASVAPAYAQESPFHDLAHALGLTADPPEPPDFVVRTRPAETPPPIPVFKEPDEPTSRVKSKDDLKSMDADLDRANARHDALRSGFAPSAKAMAEAKAAKAAKAKKPSAPNP